MKTLTTLLVVSIASVLASQASAYSKTETTITHDTPIEELGGMTTTQLLPPDAQYRIKIDPALTTYTEHRTTFNLVVGEMLDPASGKGVVLAFVGEQERADNIRGTYENIAPTNNEGTEPTRTRAYKLDDDTVCLGRNAIFAATLECAIGNVVMTMDGTMDQGGEEAIAGSFARLVAYAKTFPLNAIAETQKQ